MKLSRKMIQGILLLGAIVTMAFAFNNCGKVPVPQFDPAQLDSFDSKVDQLSKRYTGKIDQYFCIDSARYTCIHKVFSPNVESADLGFSNECVQLSSGGQICPPVHHFNYNSQAAVESCKENCQDNYDFEEFDCSLELGAGDNGVFPLNVNGSVLSGPIETLYKSCVEIQQGSAK